MRIPMQIGPVTQLIGNLLLDFVCSLEILLFLGKVRNNKLFHALLQRQSTVLWPPPLLRLFGYVGCYAVHIVSQFVSNPTTVHWAAVIRIIRYLQGTVYQSLYGIRAPRFVVWRRC